MLRLTRFFGSRPAQAIGLAVAVALVLGLASLLLPGAVPTTAAKPPPISEIRKLPALPQDPASTEVLKISRADALARNTAMPFTTDKPAPARPFRFTGGSVDRDRALECLALAALAEAGGSEPGQEAVIQVVLNRVRHPAFAKSICGVVFEGSYRATGCQFSFTCDGSLARSYSDAAWAAGRKRASKALSGKVFAEVGTATHYHTNWVFPYWSPKLDKIAQIETHLFFRWKGYWGTAAAARFAYRGNEPSITQLIARTPLGSASPEVASSEGGAAGVNALASGGGVADVIVRHPDGGAFLVALNGKPQPSAAVGMARKLCGGNGYCHVMAWTDRSVIPKGFPVPPPARAKLQFSYVLDAQNTETVLYNCSYFAGIERDRCIPPPLR